MLFDLDTLPDPIRSIRCTLATDPVLVIFPFWGVPLGDCDEKGTSKEPRGMSVSRPEKDVVEDDIRACAGKGMVSLVILSSTLVMAGLQL